MNRYPAIALIEFDSIATGTTAGDAMVKTAPIELIHSGTIHPGKYLILVGGTVASVEQSFFEGVRVGGDTVVDKIILPEVHAEAHDAVFGRRRTDAYDALGILESETVSAVVRAADAGVKQLAADHLLGERTTKGLAGFLPTCDG